MPSQELLLYWLKLYYNIFESKNNKDFDILTDRVINDFMFVDAYLAFIEERHKQELLKSKKQDTKSQMERDLRHSIAGNAMVIEYE